MEKKRKRKEENLKNLEVHSKYIKSLSDGTGCKFVFSISTKGTEWKAEEILHLFTELSKSAYIQLGNKMVYGSDNQKEIAKLVVNGHNQLVD